MMKTVLFISVGILIISCSEKKNTQPSPIVNQEVYAEYDTLAVDSFSTGATSVDVAAQIRLSSRRYQDSLLLVRKKEEAVKVANDLATKEKANAAKLEARTAALKEENAVRPATDEKTKIP